MNNSTDQNPALQARFAEVFARLPEQDIEQFYAHYQLWLLRRRVPTIEKQIGLLREHLGDNQHLIASLQPSAIALAVLVRLQSNGVSNIELLDQMLERGEDWLDRMMQRLDYCEQVEDFIQGDYTQWCMKSLEGAYDWIDTLLCSTKEKEARAPLQPDETGEEGVEATEELLLRKLSLDDDASILESTLKRPAIKVEETDTHEIEASAQELPQQEDKLLGITEQFLMGGESAIEPQESTVEAEQPAELEDWEDLESPGLRPEPWYSVNLTDDAPLDATQLDVMHDWIKMLQANAISGGEAGDTESTASQVAATPAEDSSQVESVAPEPAEINAEEPAVQQAASESVSTLSVAESQNAPESNLEREETLDIAEASGTPESVFTPHEEEAQNEPLVAEAEVSESTGQNESEPGESGIVAPADHIEVESSEAEDTQSRGEDATLAEEIEPTNVAEVTQSSSAIEEETSTNNILSEEGGELPWYEYLEKHESTIQAPQSQSEIEEHIEPENVQNISAAELSESATATPELHEYAPLDQSAAETIQVEAALAEEPEKREWGSDGIESWQAWEMQEEDMTLPMALREIRLAQETQLPAGPEDTAKSVEEAQQVSTNEAMITGEPVESAEPESIVLAQDGISTTPISLIQSEASVQETSEEAASGEIAAHAEGTTTQSAAGQSAMAEAVREEVGSAENATLLKYHGAGDVEESAMEASVQTGPAFVFEPFERAEALSEPQPAAQIEQPAPPSEEPRGKIGFWRWLFGKKRSK